MQAQGEMLKAMGEIMMKYGKLLAESEEKIAEQSEATRNTPMSQLSILSKNESGYAEITVEQLRAAMGQKDIEPHLHKLPDKDAAIVVYCKVGGMSVIASEALVELGYTTVVDMPGGFDAWKEAGYELEITGE